MITFLPYSDFQQSAQVLDRQRLGKQRLEAKQILEINLLVKERQNIINNKGFVASSYSNLCCHDYCIYDGGHSCINLETNPPYKCERFEKTWFNKIPHENQPAVRMWRTYETYLAIYGMVICGEWISRGYKDNLFDFFDSIYQQGSIDEDCPPWLGREKFHRSHQANLLSKDVKHYFKYFGDYFTNMQQGDYFIEMPYEWNREDWKEFSHE